MAEFEPSISPEPLPGRPNPRFPDEVSPASTGYGIGKGIEDVGNVASQVYEKIQDKVQRQARQTQLTDANNQLQTLSIGLLHDPKTGALAKQGKNAFNLGQQYLPQYDAASQEIINSVADPVARQAAQEAANQHRNQLTEQLDSHELDQHQKFAIQTSMASVKTAQQAMAFNYNHPDIVAANRDTIDVSLQHLAEQQGWSQDELKEHRQEIFSAAHTDVIDRMLADDKPQMAKHYLAQFKGEMNANAAWAADRTIDAHLKEKQNEQKQDIIDRFQDSITGARFGLANSVAVSKAELALAYPKDWQRKWDALQGMVRAGAQAKQYDQMPAADVLKDVLASKPTEGGPEAALRIEGWEIRRRAAEQSLQARQKDPAQFAIDSGTGWKPLDFSRPADAIAGLKSRSNTAGDISQQVGIPVPILTKTETKQLSEVLTNATPAQRLGLLDAMHSGLGDERTYYNVLHQVLPHSPVTAIAGAKVGQPDPAHTPVWYDPKFLASPADAAAILRGEQLLNPAKGQAQVEKGGFKSGFPMPPDAGGAGLLGYFQRNANNMFAGRPQLGDATYTAFRAAYAAMASDKGDMSGAPNRDLMEKAFKAVIGQTHDFNGRTISVPAGMDPTRFEGLADKAVGSMAVHMGAPADWKSRMSGYQLQEVGGLGSGTYQVLNGNALVTINGEPLVIDLGRQYSGPGAHGSPEDDARFAKRGTVSVE